MSTPERPSLADTIARIDAVLDAYYDPTTNTREVDVVTRITHIVDHAAKRDSQPPCLHCARQALRGSPYCAAHKRIPREMLEELGPVTRDGNTITINQPGVYEMTWNPGGSGEPSVAERALEPPPDPSWVTFEKPGHLPGPPGPTCPGCQADAARPGWLARALRRLFT